MECPKCHGMLKREWLSDFFFRIHTWNCTNCGAIIDRTISYNRRKSLAARSAPGQSKSQSAIAHAKTIRSKVSRLASSLC